MSRIRKIAYIQRHGKKQNPEGDKSLWKPTSTLKPEAIEELRTIRIRHGFASAKFSNVFSSGWDRTNMTAQLMSGVDATPAIELNPHAIWDDEAWRKVLFLADGKDKPARDILADHPTILKPVGLLGANFVLRQLATMNDCEMLFVTHGPLAEAITATLLDQWPLQHPVTEFKEGDIVSVDFDERNTVIGYAILSAADALMPRGNPLDE